MNRILLTVSAENLTQFETLALSSSMNLADGHARQQLMAAQSEIVAELPDMWAEAAVRPVDEIEQEAAESFFGMLGQHSHPFAADRTLSCYSSSPAMEILARSLVTTSDAVALIHPTFDNIPDILRGVGLRLAPVEEEQARDDVLPCQKFHWARPHEGERMLRLALSWNPSTLLAGARALRSALLDTPEPQG
ncbi:hypothetical protein ACLMNJ_24730 [Streptomyces seoulensis]